MWNFFHSSLSISCILPPNGEGLSQGFVWKMTDKYVGLSKLSFLTRFGRMKAIKVHKITRQKLFTRHFLKPLSLYFGTSPPPPLVAVRANTVDAQSLLCVIPSLLNSMTATTTTTEVGLRRCHRNQFKKQNRYSIKNGLKNYEKFNKVSSQQQSYCNTISVQLEYFLINN